MRCKHIKSISDGRANNSYKTTNIVISNGKNLVGLIPVIQGRIPHPITFRIAFPLKPVLIFKTSTVSRINKELTQRPQVTVSNSEVQRERKFANVRKVRNTVIFRIT